MDIEKWYQKRGSRFIWARGKNLAARYDLSGKKAEDQIKCCVESLATWGCSPTFPVPGRVLERHVDFIRHLEEFGAEIAVHGYNHVDLKACSPKQAAYQLLEAAQVFHKHGFVFHGFRCPYLSFTDELLDELPKGIFKYSSNKSIKWDLDISQPDYSSRIVETLDRFYTPQNASAEVCTPWMSSKLVEIPVCIPDDLQLFDGFRMTPRQVAESWANILEQIYQRGELFTIMYHPELYGQCAAPLSYVLQRARGYHPRVWITRLAEIADWWLEKSTFKVNVSTDQRKVCFKFDCTPRATILIRDPVPLELEPDGILEAWNGRYARIIGQSFTIATQTRPLIGVSRSFPAEVKIFLQEQGYLVDDTASARLCTIYLDEDRLTNMANHLELVKWIENTPGPIVRFWRWPDGYKCALSISGDLDAVSLLDYATRLLHG